MNRYVCGKWKKTMALMQNDEIRPFIPQTMRMTEESLRTMLSRHKMVYIKPDIGSFGNGVMRIELMDHQGLPTHYQYKLGVESHTFSNFEEMYQDIVKKLRGKSYLVQKGIQLLQFHRHKFDIRVMVQQNLRKRWETTGLIGRVGQINKVVTNVHNGGILKDVDLLLSSHLDQTGRSKLVRQLVNLGTSVAKQIQRKFPGVKAIGVDVAVDSLFKPWILEVNTKPDLYIFRKLADKSIYRKISRYDRASYSSRSTAN